MSEIWSGMLSGSGSSFFTHPGSGVKQAPDPDPHHCWRHHISCSLVDCAECPGWSTRHQRSGHQEKGKFSFEFSLFHTFSNGLLSIEKFMIVPIVLRIRDVYPGSRIRLFSIPDPGSELSPSRTRIRIKELSILTPQKMVSRKYDPGCSSRIRMLTFYPSRIPDPGGQKGTGSVGFICFWASWIRIR